MSVKTTLAKIGHGLASLFHSRQMRAAIGLAEQAAASALSNDAKRAFVVKELMEHFHIPESAARLLCELAVKALKVQSS